MMPPVSLATPVIQNCACHSERSVSVVKNLKQIAGDSSCSFGMTFACHSEGETPKNLIPQAYVMLSNSEASPAKRENNRHRFE